MFTRSAEITDVEFLRAIDVARSIRAAQRSGYAAIADVVNVLDGHPERVGVDFETDTHPNVVRSKMRRVYRRGLATGCICGCSSGGFALTDAGRELLAA